MCIVEQSEYNWVGVAKDFFVPLVSVFLGAGLAFWQDRHLRKKREKENQIEAAHFLLFVLIQQVRFLRNLRTNMKHVTSKGGFILLDPDCPKVVSDDLGFMVRDDVNLVNEVVLANRKCFSVIMDLERFNQQEAASQAFGSQRAVDVSDDHVMRVGLTEKELPQLKVLQSTHGQYWENLEQSVKWALTANNEVYPKVTQNFINKFPSEKFSKPQPEGVADDSSSES